MGLHDRTYARDAVGRLGVGGGSRLGGRLGAWSITTWLIVINVAVFVLAVVLQKRAVLVEWEATAPPASGALAVGPTNMGPLDAGTIVRSFWTDQAGNVYVDPSGTPQTAIVWLAMDPLTAYGHFSTATGFQKLEVWRLVTFQFLHGSITHLFFNMFGLYIFGAMVEEYLGRRRYLAFYLVCGVFGGLLYMALNLAGYLAALWGMPPLPALLMNNPRVPLVGASAGVFGVIVACAFVRRDERMQLIFPPVTLPMWVLAYGYVAIAALNLLFRSAVPGSNAGGDAAHLGGAAAGFFFIRNSHLLRDFFDILGDSRGQWRTRRQLKLVGGEPGARDPDEIDRILAKIKAQGRDSLTPDEEQALQEESRRLQVKSG